MPKTVYIPQLSRYSNSFPDPRNADQGGLVAWGGDLGRDRVLNAYTKGIFPWYNENDPLLWWSVDPRLVLFPKELKISKSLRRSQKKFDIKFDTNFQEVMENCKTIRENSGEGTWINQELQDVFQALHVEGFAHSVESYYEGELVGGLYGLYLGGMFCGESMFSLISDASKVALVALCQKVLENGGDFIDCQIPTEHLKSMGAVEMKREEFLDLVEKSLQCKSKIEMWR